MIVSVGLSKADVEKILTNHGIVDGEIASAKELRDAIADVITENNRQLMSQIPKLIGEYLQKEMKGMNRF